MASQELPKLLARVRFPSPAPTHLVFRGIPDGEIPDHLLGFRDPYSTKAVNMKRSILIMALVAAITAAGVSTASAAQDIFLKIDGVQGESADRAHPNEINVLEWSWGATNSSVVRAGGAGAGKATFNDLTVSKYVDSASPALVSAVSTGKTFKNLTLTVRRGGNLPIDYLTLTLTDVLVTGMSIENSAGEDSVIETIKFNYGTYAYSYVPVSKKDGTKLSPLTTKFNVMENRLF